MIVGGGAPELDSPPPEIVAPSGPAERIAGPLTPQMQLAALPQSPGRNGGQPPSGKVFAPGVRDRLRRLPANRVWLIAMVGLVTLGLIIAVKWRITGRLIGDVVPLPGVAPVTAGANPLPAGNPAVVTGQIAFVSDMTGAPDIYLLDLASGSTTRVLGSITSKIDPDWSADAQRLVFTAQDGDQHLIDTIRIDGSGIQQILSDAAELATPRWSPDGQRIAFVSKRDGNREIYTMNLDGTGITRLTENEASDFRPIWSPDGAQIAFYSDRDGNLSIFVMNADGSNALSLTSPAARDYDAAWSPDGQKIAFVSERDGNAEIYVMDRDGTDQIRLTSNDAADTSPTWSPDGSQIAFVSRRDGNANIYIMKADGTGQHVAIDTPDDELAPVWQPAP
jgi:Tol biopolymer transport system component